MVPSPKSPPPVEGYLATRVTDPLHMRKSARTLAFLLSCGRGSCHAASGTCLPEHRARNQSSPAAQLEGRSPRQRGLVYGGVAVKRYESPPCVPRLSHNF